MKKTISILLAFVFLISSSGFSINRHYCGNELESVDILIIQNDKSCCGTEEMPEDCCENKSEVIKIKEHFILVPTFNLPSTDFITVFFAVFFQSFNLSFTEQHTASPHSNSHAPPGKPVSHTILYRSILI